MSLKRCAGCLGLLEQPVAQHDRRWRDAAHRRCGPDDVGSLSRVDVRLDHALQCPLREFTLRPPVHPPHLLDVSFLLFYGSDPRGTCRFLTASGGVSGSFDAIWSSLDPSSYRLTAMALGLAMLWGIGRRKRAAAV